MSVEKRDDPIKNLFKTFINSKFYYMSQSYKLKLDPKNLLFETKEIFHDFDINEEIKVSETYNPLHLSNKFTESLKNSQASRNERKENLGDANEILYQEMEKEN